MWRMTKRADTERGAISVVVALVLVCLLGFAALAVDVGALYAERAQVQNGSDAVALMVAQKCAKSISDPECSGTWPRPSGLAGNLANGNAVDGMTNVKSITLDKTKGTVSVATGAKETGTATNNISLFFARAFGISQAEVGAASYAQWGAPSRGTVFLPLVIAECKFNLSPGASVAAEQVLEFGSGCGRVPGGFGWIQSSSTQCSMTLGVGSASDSGSWFVSDPGASAPSRCTAADLSKMNNQTVLFPLYDLATGTGNNAKYFIKGFAAFYVTGYQFASIGWTAGGTIANKTIRGHFVRFVSLSEAFELGSAPDYGADIAHLTLGVPAS